MRAGLVGYLYWRRLQKTCVIISVLPLKWVILGQISCSSTIFFLSCLSCKIVAVSETLLKGQIFKCVSGNSTVQILWKLVCIRKAHLALCTTKLLGRWMLCCKGLKIAMTKGMKMTLWYLELMESFCLQRQSVFKYMPTREKKWQRGLKSRLYVFDKLRHLP